MSQARYEFLNSKFKSIDTRLGQLRTRHTEKSAELAKIVEKYENACRAFALKDGPDPAPNKSEREAVEAQLRGLSIAIEEAQQERDALIPEWESLRAEIAKAERARAKEAARQVHISCLERRTALLKELDEVDMKIQTAFNEWDRYNAQERFEAEVAAQNAWKEEATRRGPASRRVVTIGGGQ